VYLCAPCWLFQGNVYLTILAMLFAGITWNPALGPVSPIPAPSWLWPYCPLAGSTAAFESQNWNQLTTLTWQSNFHASSEDKRDGKGGGPGFWATKADNKRALFHWWRLQRRMWMWMSPVEPVVVLVVIAYAHTTHTTPLLHPGDMG